MEVTLFIYSTFLQRAIDQIIHDIALQKAHVIFMIDRAGAVPADGPTHQGIFDIALLRPVPYIEILTATSGADLKLCFQWAINRNTAVVIRYPKLSCPTELPQFSIPVEYGRGIFVPASDLVIGAVTESELSERKNKILVVCTGGIYSEVHKAVRSVLLNGGYADLYILRFIKPFDESYFLEMAKAYYGVVFVEDGIINGGIGQYLSCILGNHNIKNTKILGFKDKFISHGSRADVLEMTDLDPAHIEKAIKECAK